MSASRASSEVGQQILRLVEYVPHLPRWLEGVAVCHTRRALSASATTIPARVPELLC